MTIQLTKHNPYDHRNPNTEHRNPKPETRTPKFEYR